MSDTNMREVERAIAALGSQAALARALGVTQGAIGYILRSKRVSVEMAIRIEKATKGLVQAHEIRPGALGDYRREVA